MIYIGVDVGAKGGMAAIDENNQIIMILPMSRENLVVFASELKSRNEPMIACIEKVGAMPNQGVTSMFSFGKSAGFIEGVFESFKIPYELITPQKWKKEFGLINKDKNGSINICKHLLPDVNLRPTSRCRKESDGLAEAALMAIYAKRRL